jgi:hypothetical protein
VDWPIEQLRAICRFPNPSSYLSRSTSLILRIDNLPAGNLIPPFAGRFACRVIIQRCRPSGCGNRRDLCGHDPKPMGFDP